MENPNQPVTETKTMQKKKLPGWAKFLIVIAILGVVGLTAVGIGLKLLVGMLTTKGGQYLTEQGIEKGLEKMIEKGIKESGGQAADIDVDLSKEGLVIKDGKSQQQLAIRADQKLPENFPTDVPVFQPSQPGGSLVMGPMTMASFETSAPAAQVISFYQTQLPAQGWSTVFGAPAEAQNMMAIYKKENKQVTVNITGEGDKASFTLTYGSLEAPPQGQIP